ncbi:hypothetical protein PHYBOEH_008892 [Phytophthora boehmeriae]|uniref:PLAC8 family protein n=1 Tax=Phytophthora boehmeriae TaxID=109152 RepID=A0A8T1W0X1_9STRA|nr:hypothetical protein PHYBOEH_008892 [Phytophthora boehmeriae]
METPSETNYSLPTIEPQVSVVVSSAEDPQQKKSDGQTRNPQATHVNDVDCGTGWGVPFFGCFSSLVPNCCMSTLCPCVSIAQIQARLGEPFQKSLINFGATIAGVVICVVLFISHTLTKDEAQAPFRHGQPRTVARSITERQVLFLCGALFFYLFYAASVTLVRMRVRKQYEIDGHCGQDCVASVFCAPCTVAQMATQAQSYTPGNCSFQPLYGANSDTLPGYSSQAASNLPPVAFI